MTTGLTPDQSVIVPTVLAFGVLFSLATLVRDALHRLRGPGWMSRRCGMQGRAAALEALGPHQVGAPITVGSDTVGRRSRRWYGIWGTAMVTLAIYLAAGSWGNYIGWTGWVESIAWIWLIFLAAIATFATLGVACLTLARRGDHAPDWLRPLLARTVLSEVPHRPSVATTVIPHPAHLRRLHRPIPVRPLGRHHVTDAVASAVRLVASIWTVVAVTALGWLTLRGLIPSTPEELDTAIAGPAWIVIYVLLVVSAVAVYRWELAGAMGMAVCAAFLALLSSIQYPSWVALSVAAVFTVPGFLHWLAWQRDHHVHHLVRVGVFTSLLVVGVWATASNVYAHYFGPTHPESEVAALPDSPVVWAWTGGTTTEATTVVARLRGDDEGPPSRARLALSLRPELTDPIWSAPVTATAEEDRVARLHIEGLEADTTYHWAVEVDGELDRVRTGTVHTMPEGPSSFLLAVSACARSGSNGAVFDSIREAEPLVYLEIGDLHYANIGTNDPGRFEAALQQLLTAPGQAALYRSTSIAYVWDDHDYAANDGDASSPSRPAAGSVYRAWAPHHPLVSDDDTGSIGQSFVAGRVRVVMTDTRSQRTPPGAATGDAQHMLGPEQEAWFSEQLTEARDAGQVVVWAGSTPWIGTADAGGSDTWAGWPDARQRTADLIATAGMADRLVVVAGDAHMVALDDGTHTDYATDQVGGFPLLQAAALDRPGSTKGGPYSAGTYPGGGQYGEIEVDDDGGDTLAITLRGRTWDGDTLVEQTFTLPVGPTGP